MERYFKHPQAIVDSPNVGDRTQIWAFSHVLPEARIGTDCNLCESVFVENDVVVGDRVTIKNGVQLWDGVRLEDDVFVGPNVTFTNDRFPRSRQLRAALPPTRICAGASIGANATILPGITVGTNAMIGAGSVVIRDVPAYAVVAGNPARVVGSTDKDSGQPRRSGPSVDPLAKVHASARLADDVEVKAGAYIHSNVRIEAGCRIGPNVSFIGHPEGDLTETVVYPGVQIGANAVIGPGVLISGNAVIRPGSLVVRSVPPHAIVEGSPAAIVGYVGAETGKPARGAPFSAKDQPSPGVTPTHVAGVTVHQLPFVHDMRGDLVVGEFERHVPFPVRRFFLVHGVPSREVRGEHAHIDCHQFLVCVRGDCAVIADDGHSRVEVDLDSPSKGLYLPPMVWGIQYKHSPDAILLVFASHYYDAADYIREYSDFTARVHAESTGEAK